MAEAENPITQAQPDARDAAIASYQWRQSAAMACLEGKWGAAQHILEEVAKSGPERKKQLLVQFADNRVVRFNIPEGVQGQDIAAVSLVDV